MTDVSDLVAKLLEVTEEEKEVKARKEELREELFAYADEQQPEHMIPLSTIEVPFSFFDVTGMDYEVFLISRFPTWDLKDYKLVENGVVFILRKKRSFLPWKYEDDSHKLTKSPTEPTPEIDWETLKAEQPELFTRIAREVVTLEIDEEEFESALKEDPTLYDVLRRHSKFTRAASQRVSVKVNE